LLQPARNLPLLEGDNGPPVSNLAGSQPSPAASDISSDSSRQSSKLIPVPYGAPELPECYRERHRQGDHGYSEKSKRNHRKECRVCAPWRNRIGKSLMRSPAKCITCGKTCCVDGTDGRYCFYVHMCECFKTSGMASQDWIEEYDAWKASFDFYE
jgi:hypothetical protein